MRHDIHNLQFEEPQGVTHKHFHIILQFAQKTQT